MRGSRARVAGSLAVALSAVAAFTPGADAGTMLPGAGGGSDYELAGSLATPAVTFSCQSNSSPSKCYGPQQIQAAYDFTPLYSRGINGRGRTIVIVDAFQSPTIQEDLAAFNQVFDLPASPLNIYAPDGLTPFDPNDPNQVNWSGEISLDVEWAHAIAPGATIDLVLAKSNSDVDIQSAERYAIENNRGDVISMSFGEAEQCLDPSLRGPQHALFDEASDLKITLLASSGDGGAAQPTCDNTSYFQAVSTPATDPDVTAVGGTILDADGETGAYGSEVAWNEPDLSVAGGGGYSVLFKRPGYQKQAVAGHKRGVPDVAYNASVEHGVLTVWSSSGLGAGLVFRFGGTSAGSPQWAGLMALADQLKGKRIGKINKSLYRLGGSAPATYFHDVTSGNNSITLTDSVGNPVSIAGFDAAIGWDAVTGLGSPLGNNLVVALANKRAT
jgi:subtilase family serine protease